MKIVSLTSIVLIALSFGKSTNADSSGIIILESFDDPINKWVELNDPVMGGRSTGTFSIEDGLGKFEGEVVDVPFLHAPGFIQARTKKGSTHPDVSSCQFLEIIARSNTDYNGYRISFGNAHAPGGKFHARGYKADLKDVSTDDFEAITIPFNQFTDFWDDATGDPIHTCQENELYCPDEFTLKNMQRLTVWGEGVGGNVSLEIKSISATGCAE